ncbi:hypothetical protein [Labilibaculum euxinus]|uniref:Uncharacterized protein n=1 Tax=Labilibaculum euxinus TaxID=2686357 RepID=A0A7M4D3I6_9BACT|nr:hypothetical protein [Labilibaculum euxinus]MUP37215.1 hypothetical protein [Labilibaculum euxinus]MVB06420.1 hypothetical protein [Labilibaculum euxinus]
MSLNDRLFKIPEASLLEYAEVVAEMYLNDSDAFIAFDSTFTPEYGTKIKDSLAAVMAQKSDQVIIDEMAEHTQMVLDAMADCNHSYKTIAYFVRKAFKGNTAVQNQFGFNDISNVRDSQAKMVLFMEQHAKTSESYQANLVAAGCSQELISQLMSKAEQLKKANIEQEIFKKKRGVITQQRTQILNEVYQLVKPINDIAQIIFSDDAARMAKYTLPKPKSSQNAPDDLIES